MDKEMKEKWIKALRSGRYKQGKYFLLRNNKYCCLGVLCNLHNKDKWKNVIGERCKYYMDEARILPLSLSKQYDISNMNDLITMNDNGKSFEEIAQYIEDNM